MFVRRDTPYRDLGADLYDADRDARTFDLAAPVIAHPPCRAWGRLRQFAKPRDDERDLAVWAMWVVRHCGGVLEHPITSRLWAVFGLRPGERDAFGGILVPVDQAAYGHRAQKMTGLYVVGAMFRPRWPGRASVSVERMGRPERERTPPDFARLCFDLARAAGGAA